MDRRLPSSSSPPPPPTPAASTPPPPSTAEPHSGAQVRARHPQTLLLLTEESAPDRHPAVLAALRPETRASLQDAIAMTWLPMAIDVEVIETVAEQLGPEETATLVEKRQREEMGSALFDGFVQTALRVFGASPVNMVKRLPSGWGHLFRNAGWIEVVSTGPRNATCRVHRLPRECTRSAAWMAALPIGLRTLYEIVGTKGTVDCRFEDAGQEMVLLTFRWR